MVTAHAIRQCSLRRKLQPRQAIAFIRNILEQGEAWQSPGGDAIRLGLYAVGVSDYHGTHPNGTGTLAVLTYYDLDLPSSIRAYRHSVMGQMLRKPGRSAAWRRLHRQGTRCRRPPTLPEDQRSET